MFKLFWRTPETLFINCEIYLILTWSAYCFIMDVSVGNQVPSN